MVHTFEMKEVPVFTTSLLVITPAGIEPSILRLKVANHNLSTKGRYINACAELRTLDLMLKRQLLYQLSYTSVNIDSKCITPDLNRYHTH